MIRQKSSTNWITLALALALTLSLGHASIEANAQSPALSKATKDGRPPLSIGVAIKALRQDDVETRVHAAESLAIHAEGGDSRAIATLIELLDAQPSNVRYHASWGLVRAGAQAVQALRNAYARETDDEQRASIAHSLGRIGLPARAAIPDMLLGLEDPHSRTAIRAAYALGAMRAREALPDLVRTYAAMRKLPSQREVARAIDAIGSDQSARQARAALIESLLMDLESPDAGGRAATRKYVIELLRVVHKDAPNVMPPREELAALVPLLEQALDDPDADVLAIVRGLGYAGGDAAAAVPRLEELAKDPRFAREAERALASIGTPRAQAILADRAALAALEKRVRTEYTLADHQGRMRLLPFYIVGAGTQGIQMQTRFLYTGKEIRRPTHVIVVFESYSEEPRFEEMTSVEWRADGKRITMTGLDRSLSSSALGVIEHVSAILPVETFERLATAQRIEGRLASIDFALKSVDRAALRHFSQKIPTPSPASAEAAP